jgi:hypothetical protein
MLVMLLMCLLLLLLSLLLISWLLLVWWQRVPLSLEPASGFEVCRQECPRFGERSTDRVNQNLLRHGSSDNLTSKMPNKTSIKTSKSIVIWHVCVFLRTPNQTYLEVGFRGFPMYRRRVLVVLLATFRCEHLGTWSASLRTLTPGQLGKQLVTYWSMSIDCCILVTSPVSARSRLTPHIERRKKEGALLASKQSAWLSLAHECEWHRLPPPVR